MYTKRFFVFASSSRPDVIRLLLFAIVVLFATPAPAVARVLNSSLAGKWAVDFGDRGCSLVRMPSTGSRTKLEIEWPPERDNPSFLFGNPGWTRDLVSREGTAEILLLPSRRRFGGRALPLIQAMRAGHGLALFNLDPEAIDALAASKGLVLEVRRERPVELNFSAAANAVKLLRQCRDELLRAWGIEPAIKSALRQQPAPIGGGIARWIRDSDYPIEAINARASGAVVMRFRVRRDGRVSDCTAVASSGHKSLDRASCQILLDRGRFEPAIGPDGQPADAEMLTRLRWALP